MQKTNDLKKGILVMVCAVMLVFGCVVAMSDTAEANVSILDYNVTYTLGEGPSAQDVEMPATEKWDFTANSHKLPAAPDCKDTNFVFVAWEDVATSERYDAEEEFLFSNASVGTTELEFKAIWGVSITFDINLSDDSETITAPEAISAEYKGTADISLPTLTATNYTFMGWAKTAEAVTADYKVGDILPAKDITGSVKLYAVWKANFFQVIYHANTGSDDADAAVTVPVDSTKYMGDNLSATIMGNGKLASTNKNYATMKDATPARSGYTFAGWATSSTATAAEYQPGATIAKMDKDVELYAVWTKAAAGTTTTNEKTSTTPQTGDNDHFALYVVMAALSLFGIAYLCFDQRKIKVRK